MPKTYEVWLQERMDEGEPEPFCPFNPMYCNDAYNFDKCRTCEEALNAWKEEQSNGTE